MAVSRSHVRTQITWTAMMDLACLFVGAFAGVMLRFGHQEMSEYVYNHLEGWLLLFAGILLANYLAGSYRLQYTYSRFNLIVTWIFSITFALLILSITSYAWFMVVIGRGVLLLTLVFYSILSLSLKLSIYRHLFRSRVFLCRTVIIGSGERAQLLRQVVENDLVIPAHQVVAEIQVADDDDEEAVPSEVVDGVAMLRCRASNLEALVRSLGVSLIIVGFDDMNRAQRLYSALKRLRFEGMEVLSPLNVFEIYRGITPLDLLNEHVLMQANLESSLPMVWRTKRLVDISTSLIGLIVLAPLGLFVAIVLKVTEPRASVFYTQTRVGQFGKLFKIYKFRTMKPGAEAETGAVWASENDARVTRVGKFLRRSRIDEIPQFMNILNGEMSLVGPRPERPEIIEQLEAQIPFYSERENVTPGLTGWAQIRYPYGSTIEDAQHKLEYDLFYMKHLSLSLDLQIMLSTLRIMLFGKEHSH